MTARNYYHRKGARGIPLYVRLCALVMAEPRTSRECAAILRTNQDNTIRTMRQLRQAGVLFVRCFMQEHNRGPRNELWTVEEIKEPPEPINATTGKPYGRGKKFPFSQEIHCFGKIVELLREGTTSHEIAEEVGLSRTTIQPMIRMMREQQFIHRSGWLRNVNGGPTPIHRLGARYSEGYRDAPRPKKRGENMERTRARRASYKMKRIQSVANAIAQPIAHASL